MPGGAWPHYRSSLLELMLYHVTMEADAQAPSSFFHTGYRPCVTSLPSLPSLDPDRLLSTINCNELVCVVSAPSFALFAGLLLLLLFFGMSYSQCTCLAVKSVSPGLGVSLSLPACYPVLTSACYPEACCGSVPDSVQRRPISFVGIWCCAVFAFPRSSLAS